MWDYADFEDDCGSSAACAQKNEVPYLSYPETEKYKFLLFIRVLRLLSWNEMNDIVSGPDEKKWHETEIRVFYLSHFLKL